MNLGFSTHIKNKPTHFVEKIWAGLINKISDVTISDYGLYTDAYYKRFEKELSDYKGKFINAKLHTIRRDEKNLWKAGNFIHFVINNRTPKRFQFAPLLKCISVQKITITHTLKRDSQAFVEVDGKILHTSEIEELAINDGFDSIEDFFSWFSQDFTGKIIHWTDLKY